MLCEGICAFKEESRIPFWEFKIFKQMKNMRSALEPMKTTMSIQQCSPEVIQLATNYVSDYLDCVESLPFDLQRSVTKLREVDQKCREHVKEIENLYESFIKENEGATSIKRRSYLLQIRRLFGLCKELGDEKIAIVQSISEAIENRNKQLEHGCKRFRYAYDPSFRSEHFSSKKDRDSKSDPAKGTKRARRQRNTHSIDKHDKIHHQYKELAKVAKMSFYDAEDSNESPTKIVASATPDDSSTAAVPTPALTRAAQRDEDKRLSSKSTKSKKDEKPEDKEESAGTLTSSSKVSNSSSTATSSTASSSAVTTTQSTSKQNKNNVSNTPSSTKTNNKGKKKKRKSNKLHTEKQSSNSGEISPIIDMPIEQDEPTYCLCQQVSFGQMIACDNLECPIEWFHFTCVRLQHKPKGKWYCPDCAAKRKRESKRDTR